MSGYFIDLVLLFSFYAFIGWALETIYASISNNRLINRGFLSGPFCPIYGWGAILIIQSNHLLKGIFDNTAILLAVNLLLAILSTTILEYLTGLVLEKIFNCKWWDYGNEFLNFQGRVCLKYSLLWGMLAYILLIIVNPLIAKNIALVPVTIKYMFTLIIILYFILDTIQSITEILDLKRLLAVDDKNPLKKFHDKILVYKRILLAFPGMYFFSDGKINNEIRSLLHDKLERIKIQIKSSRSYRV